MNYEEIKSQALENYNKMYKIREQIVSSKEYEEIEYSAPFDFLKMLYLKERLELLNNSNFYHYNFESVQEAILTCYTIKHFDEFKGKILDEATLVERKAQIDSKINSYVEFSNYLNSTYFVSTNKNIASLAQKTLNSVEPLEAIINNDIYKKIQRDILLSFNKEKQIKLLIDKGVFKKEDLSYLFDMASTKTYTKNIGYLTKEFNLSTEIIKSINLTLKGVTFDGKDGNRQKLLHELSKTNKTDLSIEKYVYVDELGNSEPAYRVIWDNKDIGNLPKPTAIALDSEYKDNPISVTLKKIKGGQGVDYGADVTINIHEPLEIAKDGPTK